MLTSPQAESHDEAFWLFWVDSSDRIFIKFLVKTRMLRTTFSNRLQDRFSVYSQKYFVVLDHKLDWRTQTVLHTSLICFGID